MNEGEAVEAGALLLSAVESADKLAGMESGAACIGMVLWRGAIHGGDDC